ncbi:MAG: DUF4179 domain-containing protein [Ruminiclostridium sp.]|nr:DUF4179 domain-containing protein [Ruminiclostridium sp.]
MNGRDIFLSLEHIGEDLVEQAEFDAFPAQRRRLRPLLAAALIAVLLLAGLVGGAVAYSQGWFSGFFRETTGGPLTQEQMAYLQEYEQVIGQAQTHDGWTIELRSILNDGTTAYIILGVTAPEGTSLEPRMDGDTQLDFFGPGNGDMSQLLTCTKGVEWDSLHMDWVEDGDGLEHTKNYVIQMNPEKGGLVDPFGPKAVYHIYIENIIHKSTDTTYYQHLLDTKYKGQDAIMFTHEETLRMHPTKYLAKGVWEFDLSLSWNSPQKELLSSPITTQAWFYKDTMSENDLQELGDITLTSVILRPLSVTFSFESADYPDFTLGRKKVWVVMKDGSRIGLLPYGAHGRASVDLLAEAPLVFDQVDHILMADGTVIPVS